MKTKSLVCLLLSSLYFALAANAQLVTNTLNPTADMFYDERSFAYSTNPPVQNLYGFPDGNYFLDLAAETEPYTERIVMRFDLSSIPAGSLRSATLRLYSRFHPAASTAPRDEIDVYQLTKPFADKNSNWLTNDVSAATIWTNPGGDFVNRLGQAQNTNNPYALSHYVKSTGVATEWDVTSLVQRWLDAGDPNYGLILLYPTQGIDAQAFFYAQDYTDPALRPQLVVVVPEAGSLALSSLGGAFLAWRWRKRTHPQRA